LAVPDPGRAAAAQFLSSIDAVEVFVTVSDAHGEPVTGLTAADFTVEEDGQRQTVSTFAAAEFPLALAVAVDRSFSVPRAALNDTVAATRRLLDALQPTDQVMVLAIGSEVETAAPLSPDRAAALEALRTLDSWGTTPLYDAALEAIDAIQSAPGRRALILLTDGDDRYSQISAADLVTEARRRDVIVYPIATGRKRPAIFAELASVTGGRSFQANSRRELEATVATIARELRLQYLLGYTPARPADAQPGWRSIRVSVKRSDVRVRSRDGYFVGGRR
jgi:Ca-activated chloride channel family protein